MSDITPEDADPNNNSFQVLVKSEAGAPLGYMHMNRSQIDILLGEGGLWVWQVKKVYHPTDFFGLPRIDPETGIHDDDLVEKKCRITANRAEDGSLTSISCGSGNELLFGLPWFQPLN